MFKWSRLTTVNSTCQHKFYYPFWTYFFFKWRWIMEIDSPLSTLHTDIHLLTHYQAQVPNTCQCIPGGAGGCLWSGGGAGAGGEDERQAKTRRGAYSGRRIRKSLIHPPLSPPSLPPPSSLFSSAFLFYLPLLLHPEAAILTSVYRKQSRAYMYR